jgi:ferredoxin-type protein NapH
MTQTIAFALSNIGFTPALKTGFCLPYLYCYGCPFASAGCPIGSLQHFVIFIKFPIYILSVLGIFGTVFGRAFCGWACPFGSFQDLIGASRNQKRRLRRVTYAKFAVLFIVVIVAWLTLDTIFCKFCPAGSLFAAIPAIFYYAPLEVGVFFYVHLATLIITVILVLIFSRFWCRYLCPLGTIGVFNKLSILTISLDPAKCEKCLACLSVCPMGITKLSDIGSSTDCIICGRCVESCSTGALKVSVRR